VARLTVLYNPLDPTRRRCYGLAAGCDLQDWLDENEPLGASCTRALYLDGVEVDPATHMVGDRDELLLVVKPGGITEAMVVQALVTFFVSAAIGYVLNQVFGPKKPAAGNTPSPSQVYGIATPRNAARLGEPIPVIYGSIVALPDYAAQPYVEYIGNEQILHALLCLGQGQHDVHSMLIGDSDAAPLPTDVARYQVFGPADHASTFGVIALATGVRENVVTSADVSDQELLAPNERSNSVPSTWYWQALDDWNIVWVPPEPPLTSPPYYSIENLSEADAVAALPPTPPLGTIVRGIIDTLVANEVETRFTYRTFQAAAYDPSGPVPGGSLVPPPGTATLGLTKWIGPFETCKAGQAGMSLELDFVFAGGLFTMDGSGNLGPRSVTAAVEFTPIDDDDLATGPTVAVTETFDGGTNTALRFTRKRFVDPGRYLVRVSRTTDADGKATTGERLNWTGLKFELVPTLRPVYGDVTLAAVVLRASNGIASDAASSIRFRVTRRLPPLGTGAPVPTANPADAFCDILLAAYGGNRPRNDDELDLPLLADLRAKWEYHNGFNAVFDQPSTVWEALGLSVQTVVAAPLPVGSRMSLIEDAPQPVRSQLFTDANIVSGSLQVTHQWDRAGTPAGVRVEFRDPRTFSADAVLDPVGAPDYQSVNLFGCTSREVAQQHADLWLDRRRLQRVSAAFATELEGLNCLPGQRIAIQAATMRWGAAAWVVRVDGLSLHVGQPMPWGAGTHAVQLRDPQGKPHLVSGVTRGASDDVIVLPAAPPFTIRDMSAGGEPTHLAFGIEGTEVTDWTVQRMRPQGAQVAIECITYVPAVWSRAAPHQRAA
jgi:Putative phage tail protein